MQKLVSDEVWIDSVVLKGDDYSSNVRSALRALLTIRNEETIAKVRDTDDWTIVS
jgi:hypothetical protein